MGKLNVTHTYAILEISPAAYREIRDALSAAGYSDAIVPDTREGEVIDMHGIAIQARKEEGDGEVTQG